MGYKSQLCWIILFFIQIFTNPNNWLIHIPTPDCLVLPLGTLVASYPLQTYYCTISIHKTITSHSSSRVARYIVSTIIKSYILFALCCDPVLVYNKTILLFTTRQLYYTGAVSSKTNKENTCVVLHRRSSKIIQLPLVWCQWLAQKRNIPGLHVNYFCEST